MKNLIVKECKLSASLLSFLFIAFGLMAFLPGYPILVSAFFVSFGLFHTFQSGRENHDVMYSVLLPVAKADVVRGRFAFCVLIEACGFALMTAVTLVRMAFLSEVAAYRSNALMGANLVFLGFALVVFGLFNWVFVRGFFKTAYAFGKPFVAFLVAAFLTIGAAESLHHLPGLGATNTLGFAHMGLQAAFLCGGALLYAALTAAALKSAIKRFERLDL
ncbi:MAG: ABC-2 transporter permease [Clostridia bacterium]|nr:ABC-2 transporter permease [Clostridia bacterium]